MPNNQKDINLSHDEIVEFCQTAEQLMQILWDLTEKMGARLIQLEEAS